MKLTRLIEPIVLILLQLIIFYAGNDFLNKGHSSVGAFMMLAASIGLIFNMITILIMIRK